MIALENSLQLSDKFEGTHPVRAAKCLTSSCLGEKPQFAMFADFQV